MKDYVNEYLAAAKGARRAIGDPAYVVRPIACADGTTLSVQASQCHYCSPRGDEGPWTAVEVWRVERDGKQIRARSFGTQHDEPYGWVPVDVVNRFIRRHGGMAEGA